MSVMSFDKGQRKQQVSWVKILISHICTWLPLGRGLSEKMKLLPIPTTRLAHCKDSAGWERGQWWRAHSTNCERSPKFSFQHPHQAATANSDPSPRGSLTHSLVASMGTTSTTHRHTQNLKIKMIASKHFYTSKENNYFRKINIGNKSI